MKYTPLQLRQVVEINQETLRHWRKVLPPLKERKGYAPCFTAGDALALKIIKEIVENLHIRIQALQPVSEELFNICRRTLWQRLERQYLVIQFSEKRIEICEGSAIKDLVMTGAILVFALKPYIEDLRNRLTEGDRQEQIEMSFPLIGLKKRSLG